MSSSKERTKYNVAERWRPRKWVKLEHSSESQRRLKNVSECEENVFLWELLQKHVTKLVV